MLSFNITDDLTKKLKEITDLSAEKRAFLDTLSPDHQQSIHRYALISTIGSTTRIENAILTDVEIDWMDEMLSQDGRPTAFIQKKKYIENKLSKESERSVEEVAGCRNMLTIVYAQARELFPLSETTVRGLHAELLRFYPPAAHYLGKYKTSPNSVIEMILGTNTVKDVLKTADPGPVTIAAMHELIDWYNANLKAHPWSIAVACELVFRFLAIHPFQDGNGRIGRSLFALAILQSDDKNLAGIMPYIALDRHIEKNKEEYYLVLRKCSKGRFLQDPKKYKIEYFLTFMLKMISAALRHDIEFYARRYDDFLSLAEAPRKVLACFKEHPEEKLGTGDVVKYTKIPRRTAVYALNILLEERFLQKKGKGPATKYQLIF
ncbi:MAG: Fic family protein [Pseudomonadota bacterium]